jgi:hypothetical protein
MCQAAGWPCLPVSREGSLRDSSVQGIPNTPPDQIRVTAIAQRVSLGCGFAQLNGHSFIEQELKRKQIGFRKNDNAFLAVDNVAELQAAADRLSAEIIGKQLDYWTFLLGRSSPTRNAAK